MRTINEEMLKAFRQNFENDPHAKSAQAACARTEIKDLVYLPMEAAKLNGEFSVEVRTRGITAQLKSGRCWMFALLNMLREEVADRCGLKEFEISENYLAFYDKLEKSNNVLEMAIRYADKDLDDRMSEYILDGFTDGGYWDMASDLVVKYGIVPKSVMPETYQSSHTERFTRMQKSLLRKDICELRKMVRNGEDPSERKQEMLAEIYKAECIVFGEPVQSFDFTYRDIKGEYHADYGITPLEFLKKYTGFNPDDYICCANEPTAVRKMNSVFEFHYIGCMADRNVRFLNLPMDELKDLAIRQLKSGKPVYFGCDSGAYGDRQEGVWDPASFDYANVLGGADFFMNKTDRLEYRDSSATHAMILVGVNLNEEGKPDRWKIENSWGKEVGKNGIFVCSDAYFDEFVYQAVIHKSLLNEKQLALLEAEAEEILPWAM